jgi:hypothetical protein
MPPDQLEQSNPDPTHPQTQRPIFDTIVVEPPPSLQVLAAYNDPILNDEPATYSDAMSLTPGNGTMRWWKSSMELLKRKRGY